MPHMSPIHLAVVGCLLLCGASQAARILGIFPMPAKSHYILARALMRGLAERGHDVTVVNPFGEKDLPRNGSYTDILMAELLQQRKNDAFNLFDFDNMNPVTYQLFMNFMGNMITEVTLNHTNVQKLLRSSQKFDVVIVEQFLNEAHKGFAHHFGAPLILLNTFGSNAWINPLVGNPAPPAYVAEQTITFTEFDFWFRLKNLLIYVLGEVNRHLLFFPRQNELLQQYFPGAPHLRELNYNASLVLLNSHISTNQPVPRVPSMVDIGGYHVEPPKRLPSDLQEYLDGAAEGVIYFSMGSNIQSASMPDEKRDAFLRVFARLKQKVLWKWEGDAPPGQPPNLRLGKWFPQQDILAHPNVKLFITHGGLLSLIETVYHGKPVLAIPVFGDQKINAANVGWSGYGRTLYYSQVNQHTLAEAINDLLSNPKYSDNAKRRSQIFHDRPIKPMDEADFWVRHIIRHGGGAHLRVAALDLAWYQYLCLDVAAALIVTLVVILCALKCLIKAVFGRMFGKGDKPKKKTKTQ